MEGLKQSGYSLKSANVNFIIYWKDPDKEREFKIILPEVSFEKQS
jgi:hypothetical protein